jgi:hypothetical protein
VSLPALARNGFHAPAIVRPGRPLIQRLARAWLRHQLDRRVEAEFREDDRLHRLERLRAGGAGQVFRAVQVNLASWSR